MRAHTVAIAGTPMKRNHWTPWSRRCDIPRDLGGGRLLKPCHTVVATGDFGGAHPESELLFTLTGSIYFCLFSVCGYMCKSTRV